MLGRLITHVQTFKVYKSDFVPSRSEIKAMIQILAKFSSGDMFSQRAIRCGDNTDVRTVQALTPNALELAILNCP